LLPEGRRGFALIGTTMAPAFDWSGFELGERETLVNQYPAFRKHIVSRTRA